MAKTQSMTRNQDYDVHWSDLNHDVLFLVMVRLGVIDFVLFSGVCKSWRSLALSNWPKFMSSKPPMSIRISTDASIERICYLEDFERRKFKTMLPHSGGRKCVGLISGYLIFFGREINDFWLVNPVTRHQLRFPNVPFHPDGPPYEGVRGVLVFSPSISGWVLVATNRYDCIIWFSIEGKGEWNHVSTTWPIYDFHACKGNIYALHCSVKTRDKFQLCEIRLNPHPKLTLLEPKNFPKSNYIWLFDSLGANLYLMHLPKDGLDFHELDFGEMKWVPCETPRNKYAYFFSSKPVQQACTLSPKSWADPWLQFGNKNSWEDVVDSANMYADMWYFPHDCLNVNLMKE